MASRHARRGEESLKTKFTVSERLQARQLADRHDQALRVTACLFQEAIGSYCGSRLFSRRHSRWIRRMRLAVRSVENPCGCFSFGAVAFLWQRSSDNGALVGKLVGLGSGRERP